MLRFNACMMSITCPRSRAGDAPVTISLPLLSHPPPRPRECDIHLRNCGMELFRCKPVNQANTKL
jgi:hypothetical protein